MQEEDSLTSSFYADLQSYKEQDLCVYKQPGRCALDAMSASIINIHVSPRKLSPPNLLKCDFLAGCPDETTLCWSRGSAPQCVHPPRAAFEPLPASAPPSWWACLAGKEGPKTSIRCPPRADVFDPYQNLSQRTSSPCHTGECAVSYLRTRACPPASSDVDFW